MLAGVCVSSPRELESYTADDVGASRRLGYWPGVYRCCPPPPRRACSRAASDPVCGCVCVLDATLREARVFGVSLVGLVSGIFMECVLEVRVVRCISDGSIGEIKLSRRN